MRRQAALLAFSAAALGLAGCGGPADAPTPPQPSATPEGPSTLVPASIDLATLGPRIVGPEGPEVESVIAGLGTMVSYVACPGPADDARPARCDPATQPDDTLYTYVHRVTLAEQQTASASEPATTPPSGDALFQTTLPAPGFSLMIGYDEAQAIAALGEDYDIKPQIEDGALIWRIVAGKRWMPGETLTFYWRSTLPPAGPTEAFRLEIDGKKGLASGPFPAEPGGDDALPNDTVR